ncbi:unnamed protein product [Paramecium sonneborni]|uniref:Protein kinase domain-containing protein n=1 Tax=Paramecium sonneborni TaxID=65129 RepID=A0A8S1M216_9CILI|nr:unnamed protein product [Paramecium sonneborni]
MSDPKQRAMRLNINPIETIHQGAQILKKLAFNINSGGSSTFRAFSAPNADQNNRMQLEIPSQYNTMYEEIAKIGQGNFAIVFKCRNILDQSIYAIKKTKAQPKQNLKNSDARQEACILAKLFSQSDTKHIVQYYNCWIEQNQFFLVMEYCDYNLKHQQQYQEWEVKIILKHILEGLRFLHNKNLVHMDIKPENILFKKKDLSYKLADFGLSRLQFLQEEEDIRDGDQRYTAPEIMEYMNFGTPIDLQKVDIFALGCTIFELMIQEELPKSDNQYHELRRGINKRHFKDVGILYSDSLIDIVCQMMTPKQENRPTADQLLQNPYLFVPQENELKFLEESNNLMFQEDERKKKLLENEKKRRKSIGSCLELKGKYEAQKYLQNFINRKRFDSDQQLRTSRINCFSSNLPNEQLNNIKILKSSEDSYEQYHHSKYQNRFENKNSRNKSA